MQHINSHETPFEVLPLGNFGAEITGIDLVEPLTEEIIRRLKMILALFQVLVFRDQNISPSDQTRITQYFGSLEPGIPLRPKTHQVPGHPDLLYLSNKLDSPTRVYGSSWHSDGLAYARTPHGVTMLYCIECPPYAGDTLFANQYEAYEKISKSLQEVLIYSYWHLPVMPFSEVPVNKGLVQPLVRTHPQTGRKFIFCAQNACQIRGMTRKESSVILNIVHNYQVEDDIIYGHSWHKRDLVFWENCTLLHNRADEVDYLAQGARIMNRSATEGDYEAIECEAAET